MKLTVVIITVLMLTGLCNAQHDPETEQNSQDAWQLMLSQLNLNESNLGFKPKGYWTRYPDPKDIPFKLLAFDDLFAEPQRIYDFVKIMALSVEDYLHPDYLSGSDRGHSKGLLKVAYYCGVRNATAQFRDYSASLWAELDEEEPLLLAIKAIYNQTGRVYRYNAMGQAADFPLLERDFRQAIEPINPQVRVAIARTLLHLLEAHRFQQIGMRNVDYEKALSCWRIRHLGETEFDGLEYFPQLEDCARNVDINSIYYAGYKLLASAEMLADSLSALLDDKGINWKKQNLNVVTPIGRIVLSGSKNDVHQYSDAFLLVDFGGNDTYRGAIGSTPSLNIPISLAVDLSGHDKYINEDEYLPSQGAAIFGAGVLLDVSGDDIYRSKRLSQGAAMLGIGVLADMEGDDEYHMWTSGQGGAYFGVGVAIDNSGDDKYTLWGDGQGYGGLGGVGTLINRTGSDHYRCEPLSENAFRPDYHSKDGKYNYSYSQGCGIGRRGDITDGHSWAGGMGTIIDLRGDDLYESANWSLGCGYWYGMGFAYDGGGDDVYRSANWTQASGAHFGIGALIDEGGNDEHIVHGHQSAGLGFGHDFTISLLLNRGGNDKYRIRKDGLGYAINMSQVFFFDTEGEDRYVTGGGRNYGRNNFRQYNPPIIGAFQMLFADQICLFADVQGKDSYLRLDSDTEKTNPDPDMADGVEFYFPTDAQRDSLSNKRYYGLGKDIEEFNGPEIEAFRDKMKKRFEEFK
ncbi:hypothetical protein CEE37_00930 [candidate division LCP-89 bacterium B3_LCP]|uniref:Uncharacterized protein n=1 Tax=candidate division LCP-89 bacterium B3_LCP TaxID=2012998 RepID=A0A532V4Z0_UNCL8|nr:MAG: hypothetical protein CEE37_00930 [candidate division LCP-89 bacterium B3_LCP]